MLTDTDRLCLDLAGRTYVHAGARDQAILEEAGLSPTRFWQRVNALLEDPAAYEYAPMTVTRLVRLRRSRQRSRASRRSA